MWYLLFHHWLNRIAHWNISILYFYFIGTILIINYMYLFSRLFYSYWFICIFMVWLEGLGDRSFYKWNWTYVLEKMKFFEGREREVKNCYSILSPLPIQMEEKVRQWYLYNILLYNMMLKNDCWHHVLVISVWNLDKLSSWIKKKFQERLFDWFLIVHSISSEEKFWLSLLFNCFQQGWHFT